MREAEIYQKAKNKVRAKKGFFFHLISYIGVLAMIYAIISVEEPGNYLPVIVVGLSWGIGLAMHYFGVFGTEHLEFLGIEQDWEERELEKELDKLYRKNELRQAINEEQELLESFERLDLKEFDKKRLDRY